MYDIGVDHAVLYPPNAAGVVWNGLISVDEDPDGSDVVTAYFDGVKYIRRIRPGNYQASISVYYWPDEFLQLDGRVLYFDGQQRSKFDMSWRTEIAPGEHRIHLLYGCLAAPTTQTHQTHGSTPSISDFSWTLSADTHLIVDTTLAHDGALVALLNAMYGNAGTPTLPSVDDVVSIFEANALLRIVDNGDGTWTATDNGDYITMIDDTTFQIDAPTAIYISSDTYKISSF